MLEQRPQHLPDTQQGRERSQVESRGVKSNVSSVIRRLSPDLAEQGENILDKWQTAFPRENTWVQRELGIPSLITRLDATVIDGELKPYEVEERPGGIGLAYELNSTFRNRLDQIRTRWPDFGVVVSDNPQRRWNDDDKWAPIVDKNTTGLVLVRAEPDEEQFHHLEEQSVSSLIEKGDKSYGVEMGLWEEVSDPNELPWAEPFVGKPLSGSKTRDVFVWLPKSRYKEYTPPGSKSPKGVHTQTKIKDALEDKGSMYVQPFYPPMETDNPEFKYEIFRTFYGYDMEEGKWTHLGGFTNARNNLIIHGASDTLFHNVE